MSEGYVYTYVIKYYGRMTFTFHLTSTHKLGRVKRSMCPQTRENNVYNFFGLVIQDFHR